MARKKAPPEGPGAPALPPEGPGAPALPPVHVIHPDAIYFLDQVKVLFRLSDSTVRRELREGRLKVSKRAGRYFLLGKWLIEWLEGGLLRRGKGRTPDRNGQAAD
jgi:hypothetical protein